jgi:GT2 family glycosyltransferase
MGWRGLSLLRARNYAEQQIPAFEPAAMLHIEISETLTVQMPVDQEAGREYSRALVLARLHTWPLGIIELPAYGDGISPDTLARGIWDALGPKINAHLRDDGLPEVSELSSVGVAAHTSTPPCVLARHAFMADVPFVSVIIPTHDRPEQLAALVHSIIASDYPSTYFEIIVVDSAPSSDATSQIIERYYKDSSQVRYVREDRAGSSNARNRGVALARGEIVAFADDDVLVDHHWLAEMVRGFYAGEDVGCVTGLIVPLEMETQTQEWFEQFGGFCKSGFARRMYNLTNHRPATPLFPYNVGLYGAGASMAFRRSALLAIKGFDPALGPATLALGGEDIDAMLRMILGGRTLLYSPAAITYHRARREYAQFRRQMQGYGRGLAACLFKSMITQPRQLRGFIGKVPRGLLFALDPRSPHHAEKRSGYPAELSWIEMMGLLSGPPAYLLSRRRVAHRASLDVASMYAGSQAFPVSELH